MSRTSIIFVALILFPHLATAQQTEPPRTDWDTPDFSGYWEYNTATPLERPTDVADKPVLTPAEEEAYMVGLYEAIRHERNLQLNADWWQPGTLTNGAQTIGLRSRLRPADGPEDRERYERCIMGRTVPLLSQAPGKLAQIFQTPKYLAILHEQNSDLRIIPIASTSRSEHISENIRHWQGDSRAHWEGDTLVIEVTNFNGAWTLAGESKNVRYVERLSIGAMNTIDYEFTAHDTESFATPWTVTFPIARATGPLFENACHEGNHSMPLILNGARVQERAAHPDTP
jgi:hypothetical protein